MFFLAAFLSYSKATKNKKSTGKQYCQIDILIHGKYSLLNYVIRMPSKYIFSMANGPGNLKRSSRFKILSAEAYGFSEWKYLVLSMVSIATAMLCKEQGITVAGVCAAYELFVIQKVRIAFSAPLDNLIVMLLQVKLDDIKQFLKSAITAKSSYHLPKSNAATKRLLLLFFTTLLLLLARLQIMGSQLPVFTRFDNPASVAPTPSRQLTYHYLISVNLWLLLFPCNLCCDWTMGTIPLVESFLDPRNITTVASYFFFITLVGTALMTENRHRGVVLIMVSISLMFI